jgi:hypothetical protein
MPQRIERTKATPATPKTECRTSTFTIDPQFPDVSALDDCDTVVVAASEDVVEVGVLVLVLVVDTPGTPVVVEFSGAREVKIKLCPHLPQSP